MALGQRASPAQEANAGAGRPNLPPLATQAQRFLAQRGLKANQLRGGRAGWRKVASQPHPQSSGTATWQAIGPTAVSSPSYGLVTGRVSALALDPSDPTGNRLYLGAAGGGVWVSQNAGAGSSSSVVFLPITDTVAALSGARDASISIGALTVQPGGTGVILAGTGDPNDALDSYYGAGILRSADGGNTWSLIEQSADALEGESTLWFSFAGEGFAGFAWSTANPQLAVAAVSQAYEGTLVNAENPGASYEGLYYSSDGGATWHLATITDGGGADVQGPADVFAQPDGSAATSVVWNPVRQLFVAAVRFHGYYQSTDGITWTRMAAQPGSGLGAQACPTNPGSTGSPDCPIFRGTLAVNPLTGDTFAWTVDLNNQDQGLWQDQCMIAASACATQNIAFARQWNTAALETNDAQGPATIENGDYNLALAAVPSQQDTLLLAGENDLWKCSLAVGCVWRNTTNANTCMSAQVGGYQHALAWSAVNPLEIFIGNDSGIWRSVDAIGETGPVCAGTDADHFENLNGSLGSLAEVVSMSQAGSTPYTMMLGLGVNGTAGVKGSGPVADWPAVLGGEGGPVAIDPGNGANWYANNQAGVSIHLCSQSAPCTPAAFGLSPVVNDADVDGDGLTMTTPAPFLVDPVDRTQLLIGTCRVWRGPASGIGWSTINAISPILDGNTGNVSCNGDALIRLIAAAPAANGNEAIYVGMFGAADGGSTLAGHVLGAILNPAGMASPVWQDLTLNPVTNDSHAMNADGLDISSIFIDPHDTTGNTVYVTVEGFSTSSQPVDVVYRSTDGGAHWANLSSNLPPAPVNSLVVDPQDASTVYIATDAGVFSTRQIATCTSPASLCWSAFGTGLPGAPAVSLAASPATSSSHVLTAATYGRGVWTNPLWTAGNFYTTATVAPTALIFAKQVFETSSSPQTVTLKNTGTLPLTSVIAMSGDFSETDNCQAAAVNAGANCTVQVTFTPTQTGSRTGGMTISANVSGGQLTVALSGTGVTAGAVSLLPASLGFGSVEVGTTSAPLQVTAANSGGAAVAISSTGVNGPFSIASNVCGASLAAGAQCQVTVEFAPTQAGAATGTFTMTDGAGTQTVQLSGAGAAAPTDVLSATLLTFPATVEGQASAPLVLALTNNGGFPLTSIGVSVSGAFQVSQNCGTTLPAQSSCAISVIFVPNQLGNQTGAVTVSDALRSQTVSLSGVGVAPPAFAVSPETLSFAARDVGTSSLPLTLTVSNTGGAPMANVGLQISGQSSAGFRVSSTTCGAVLQNGSSCTAQVTFTPATTGGNSATLTISSSTEGVKPAAVPLSGTGLAPPALSVQPPTLLFNGVIVGSSGASQPVTMSNTGGVALNDMQLAISGDFGFSAGSCSAVLAAGASCAAAVTFSPTATGSRTGVFTASSVSGAAKPATVSLSGAGLAPATIQTSTSGLSFGSVQAGQVSSAKSLMISNLGPASLAGLSLTVTGPFELQQNQCGSSLGANLSCSTRVAFAPVSAGALAGTLTVASTTKFVSPVVVALTGTGLPAPALLVSPQQLIFGSVPLGSASSPLNVGITDPGGAALAGLALTIAGDFALNNNTCGTSLAVNGSCGAQVVFFPAKAGIRTGTLTVSSTSTGVSPVVVQLSGSGLLPGSLETIPSNLTFGSVLVGQSSAPQTVTAGNTGQTAANGLQIKLTGDYGLTANHCGSSLPGAENCTMQVTFSPTAVGNRAGTLTVSSTTAGVASTVVELSGTGAPPGYLTVTPAQAAFPSTVVGSTSSAVTVTLTNPGIATVGGLLAQTVGDFSASICGASLPSGGSCKVQILFSPTATGSRTGQLTITSTAPGVAPAIVALSGTATPPPSLSLNPAKLNFPATAAGQTSASQTIAVSNLGSAPLNTPVLAVTGDFHVTANACAGALAAQGSCSVLVDFTPTAEGGRTGALTVSSATSGVQPVTASLTGTGLAPAALGVSPLQLTFPVVLAGQSSAAQTVTITDRGGVSIPSLNLMLTPQFSLGQNTCIGALAAGASCTAGIVFQPAANGPVTGGLTVSSASVAIPASVALSGVGGVPPGIQLQPGLVNFPQTGVGLASAPITVTISNPGTVTGLSGLSLAIAGSFQLVNNTCAPALAPMASCTAGIEFVPSFPGTQQGSLSVGTPTVPGGTISLYGMGFDFTVTPSGATSQTVSNGQTASYNLSIAPLNGSQGVFTFQCGSLPPNAACSFNPASEGVTASATGYVAVQVATGQNLQSSRSQGGSGWRVLSLACGLLLLPLAWRRRRKTLLLSALLAIMAGSVSSCVSAMGGTGGRQPPTGPGITPAGTYSIPVTVSSNGLQHQVTLTMTVD